MHLSTLFICYLLKVIFNFFFLRSNKNPGALACSKSILSLPEKISIVASSYLDCPGPSFLFASRVTTFIFFHYLFNLPFHTLSFYFFVLPILFTFYSSTLSSCYTQCRCSTLMTLFIYICIFISSNTLLLLVVGASFNLNNSSGTVYSGSYLTSAGIIIGLHYNRYIITIHLHTLYIRQPQFLR